MSSTEKSMAVKLLYSKDRQEFLMMEVGRDILDLLYSFLSLPFASIVNLFQGSDSRLVLTNMHKLLTSLNEMRDSTSPAFWPTAELQKSCPAISLLPEKDPLNDIYCCANLACRFSPSLAMTPHSLCPNCKEAMTTPVPLLPGEYCLYYCSTCSYRSNLSRSPSFRCPKCGRSLGYKNRSNIPVHSHPAVFFQVASAQHLAKDTRRFIVTEGLVIVPASAIDGIMILSKAQRSTEIVQRDINLNPEEVMEFLRASVTSECVLNKLFAAHINNPK